MRGSKYEPLKRHLMARKDSRIPMTFAEIERILGFSLPRSARTHRAWWSNNPTNNVMTHAWLEAGYRTAQVDLASERLVFERINAGSAASEDRGRNSAPLVMTEPDETAANSSVSRVSEVSANRRRPLYGMMRGTLRIKDGVDLTAPAAPEWGERAEGEALRQLKDVQPQREEC